MPMQTVTQPRCSSTPEYQVLAIEESEIHCTTLHCPNIFPFGHVERYVKYSRPLQLPPQLPPPPQPPPQLPPQLPPQRVQEFMPVPLDNGTAIKSPVIAL